MIDYILVSRINYLEQLFCQTIKYYFNFISSQNSFFIKLKIILIFSLIRVTFFYFFVSEYSIDDCNSSNITIGVIMKIQKC